MIRSRWSRAGLFTFAVLFALWASTIQPGLAQDAPSAAGVPGDLELITAPQLQESAAPGSAGLRIIPTPESGDRRELEAAKRRAATLDPAMAGQQADDIEEFAAPESLSHTVNVTFPGLDFGTSIENGNGSLAPDTSATANSSRVLEATKFGLRLSNTAGSILASTNLNAFFSAPDSTYGILTDAKVYFDRTSPTPRFFIVADSSKSSTKVSKLWIAVSRSSGPGSLASANWCRYVIDARLNAGGSLDSWAYSPGIGVGADALVIAVDNLTWSASNFTYAVVRVFRKLVLEGNAGGCPSGSSAAMKMFKASTTAGNDAARSLQPVQHFTNPPSFTGVTNPVYLMATDPFGFTNEIRIWRVANAAATAAFAGPYVLSGGLSYDIPPDSPQLGSANLLNTWDTHIPQAVGLGNTIHGVFATVCNIGGGATESCIRYVRVGITGPTLGGAYQQQLTFGASNAFYWSPGVAVNLAGKVLIVFQRSSSNQYLRTGYSGKAAAATVFEAANPMPNGTCPLTTFGNPAWTADSVGAQADPGGVAFWLAGERAATIPDYTGCWWTTDVRKVTPP
ncbi:MAG TPA: hypothetical protein VGK88_05735 [bacterium]|jgi:hypothetical protein